MSYLDIWRFFKTCKFGQIICKPRGTNKRVAKTRGL